MTLKFVTVCFVGHACVVFAVVYNNTKFLSFCVLFTAHNQKNWHDSKV